MNFQALAASGLRSLRYACEIDDIAKVVAVDYDPSIFFLLSPNAIILVGHFFRLCLKVAVKS